MATLNIKTHKQAGSAKRTRLIKMVVLITLSILVVVGLPALYFVWVFHNRAADAVAPLGNELIKNGAVKICDGGDPGRGPDTSAAYYGASYDLRLSKGDAISLITRTARDNGFNLTHASPANRGHLSSVADMYIDHWYFDNTSKQNPYFDIRPGPIELAVSVDEPGSNTGCKSPRVVEAGHVVIGVGVQLPEFRR